MDEILELTAGVVRTSRTMNDGRTIRYYDTAGQTRTVPDQRPAEAIDDAGAGGDLDQVGGPGRGDRVSRDDDGLVGYQPAGADVDDACVDYRNRSRGFLGRGLARELFGARKVGQRQRLRLARIGNRGDAEKVCKADAKAAHERAMNAAKAKG